LAESAAAIGSLTTEHIQRAREAMQAFQESAAQQRELLARAQYNPGAIFWQDEINAQRNQRADNQRLVTPPFLSPSLPANTTTDHTVLTDGFLMDQNNWFIADTLSHSPSPVLRRKKKECLLYIAKMTLQNQPIENIIEHIKNVCKTKRISFSREYTFKTEQSLDAHKVIIKIKQFTNAPRWPDGKALIYNWILNQRNTSERPLVMAGNGPEFLHPGEEQ